MTAEFPDPGQEPGVPAPEPPVADSPAAKSPAPVHGTPAFTLTSRAGASVAFRAVRRALKMALSPLSDSQRAWVALAVRDEAASAYDKARGVLLDSVANTPGVYDGFKVVATTRGENLSVARLREKFPTDYTSLLRGWAPLHKDAWERVYTPEKPVVRLDLPERPVASG